MSWIIQNIGTILVSALLIAAVAGIIISMIRKKRRGRSMVCGCGSCKACAMSGSCHKEMKL
ncbi:MAG: FeoB-associated Cys-rich membrane protein [Firmicutes bacterium]|nr:FeoB-associated Cys-rich membrane protein [Bacillota bacterium]